MGAWQRLSLLALALGGVGIWASFLTLARLSSRFIYGQDHELRPILEFLGWMAIAGLSYLAGVWGCLRLAGAAEAQDGLRPNQGRSLAMLWILVVGLAARGVLLDSRPVQEVDHMRYLWDGAVLAQGVNPYRFSPEEVFPGRRFEEDPAATVLPDGYGHPAAGGGEAYTAADLARLAALRRLREGDPRAAETHRWISYREVRTVYPPLAQGLFFLAQLLCPWSLYTLRLLFLACECGTLLCLGLTCLRLGLSPLRLLVYAWSPLAIKELINSPHIDALAVFCLALALYGWVSGRLGWMAFALGLGCLAKTFPLLLLPAAAVAAWRREGPRTALRVLGVALGTILAGYLPFSVGAEGHLLDGLLSFASEWRRNEGLYLLLDWTADQAAAALDWTDWTLGGRTLGAAQWLARGLGAILLLCVTAMAAFWPARRGAGLLAPGRSGPATGGAGRGAEGLELPGRWLITLAALFLLTPTANPWYATWLLPFLALFPVRGLLLLTVLVFLAYFGFFLEYHEPAYREAGQAVEAVWGRVRLAEYLPVYALLFCDGLRRAASRRGARA